MDNDWQAAPVYKRCLDETSTRLEDWATVGESPTYLAGIRQWPNRTKSGQARGITSLEILRVKSQPLFLQGWDNRYLVKGG